MPWTPLHDRLHQTLRQRQLLQRGDRLLVAVSGGQDSLCLLQLLQDLQPKWQWQLGVVHCDHRWRADSADNAAAVAQWVRRQHLPFYLNIAETDITTEAAARQWRYQVFTDIAEAEHYPQVVTGHTLSDRAETLLYNLVRGAGAEGLQALVWQRRLTDGVRLVRPLLEISRQETGALCQHRQLPVWQDETNFCLDYARNRIRLELLPYLRDRFHGGVEANLAKTAELLRADVAYLEASARAVLQQAVTEDGHLDRRILTQAPLALQRRALRQFLSDRLSVTPSFAQVEKLVALIDAPNRSQTDPFPGGAIARVSRPVIEWIDRST